MNLSLNQPLILEDKIKHISNEFLNHKYINWLAKRTYKELCDMLLNDLNRLIRLFEIYLCEHADKLKIEKKLLNIENIRIDHLLSFNYSNTYERTYGDGKIIEYDYIHGKANINNTIESNNMVLGIDEYLDKDRKDKDIQFIEFKSTIRGFIKEQVANIEIGFMK